MQPQQPLGCSYDAYQLIHPERIALGGGCTGAAANSRPVHHRSQIKREQSLAQVAIAAAV
jgi:hypothetical protein